METFWFVRSKRVLLPTPNSVVLTYDSLYDFDIRFSEGHKHSYTSLTTTPSLVKTSLKYSINIRLNKPEIPKRLWNFQASAWFEGIFEGIFFVWIIFRNNIAYFWEKFLKTVKHPDRLLYSLRSVKMWTVLIICRGGSKIFVKTGCTTKEWRNWLVKSRASSRQGKGGWCVPACTLPLDQSLICRAWGLPLLCPALSAHYFHVRSPEWIHL